MKKYPNFICIGSAKAGTTTLYDVLKDHPDVYLPPIKETHFFDDPKYWNRGIEFYQEEYFSGVQGEKIIGEMTPSYIYFDDVPKRIFDSLGKDTKFVLMLRNPVTRALSHYKMHVSRGNETISAKEAFETEASRLAEADYQTRARISFIDRGYYAAQLKRWLEFFPFENFHIVIFEEYIKDKANTYFDIEEFLGISHVDLNTEQRSNYTGIPRHRWIDHVLYRSTLIQKVSKVFMPSEKIRKKFKMWLKNKNTKVGQLEFNLQISEAEIFDKYFKKDIAELETLLGRDLDLWKYS